MRYSTCSWDTSGKKTFVLVKFCLHECFQTFGKTFQSKGDLSFWQVYQKTFYVPRATIWGKCKTFEKKMLLISFVFGLLTWKTGFLRKSRLGSKSINLRVQRNCLMEKKFPKFLHVLPKLFSESAQKTYKRLTNFCRAFKISIQLSRVCFCGKTNCLRKMLLFCVFSDIEQQKRGPLKKNWHDFQCTSLRVQGTFVVKSICYCKVLSS